MPDKILKCYANDCEKEAKVKGLCIIHYNRMWRHGSYEVSKTKREALIEKGLSYCPKCNETKPLSEFNKDIHTAFKIAIYCKKCSGTKSKIRYENYKDEHRNTQLKSDYKITLDEYNEILSKQNNKCAICGNAKNGNRRMCVDHNHSTGDIRGLLCGRCNLGIGSFTDDIDLLKKAIIYLEKFKIKWTKIK
jgi:hypothetical protein